MTLLNQLGTAVMTSEFVSRKVKRYNEDADYRYRLQENIVFSALVFGGAAVIIGGIVYLSKTTPDTPLDEWAEFTKAAGQGLNISADILENLAYSQERQYFETPQGMFAVEFYDNIVAYTPN